jgi:hypothetical protein
MSDYISDGIAAVLETVDPKISKSRLQADSGSYGSLTFVTGQPFM